ncbi:P-loop containing nucleoside triphosphate hydrolase protein [Ascodesmis nigricans]|uniref:Kinesin-like protein n=1 Tax=Ascodesmis nigricans TaxID=341454 RepID=A0A4S2N090_9PEZI|nr:P-loop containing nucleoside triphosphate hydrolase protein [Ascodesmis nigricans]
MMDPPQPPTNSNYFQVFLRLRPPSIHSVSPTRFLTASPDSSHIFVTPPPPSSSASASGKSYSRPVEKFTFTRIFDEDVGQREVFEETVMPLVEDVLTGRDAMVAAMGVTGSGKSHTVIGGREKGLVQMALEMVYRSLEGRIVEGVEGERDEIVMDAEELVERMEYALDSTSSRRPNLSHPSSPSIHTLATPTSQGAHYAVLLSMYELYNDRIFDLLDEAPLLPSTTRRKPLLFKSPSIDSLSNKKHISGLRKIHCPSLTSALTVLSHGLHNRRAYSTNSNPISSRSHAFITLELRRFSSRHHHHLGTSTLSIIDLAGSERAKNTLTSGDRLAEAGSINRSLMSLGQCLQLQCQHHLRGGAAETAGMIVRQSKLTELLFANSLAGGEDTGRQVMIVTADPRGDWNATTQILRYSAAATEVAVPRRRGTVASKTGPKSIRSVSAASSRSAVSTSFPHHHQDHPHQPKLTKSHSTTTSFPRKKGAPPSSSAAATTAAATAQDQNLTKDDLITLLLTRLETTTAALNATESRCLQIEQSIREEMALEMEQQIAVIMQETREARWKEEERREGFVDGKLEILVKGLEITSPDTSKPHSPISTTTTITDNTATTITLPPEIDRELKELRNRNDDLERENEKLRHEVAMLNRELNNRSPTAASVLTDGTRRIVSGAGGGRIVSGSAGNSGPRKISVKKRNRIVSGNRTEAGRPLMCIENGRLDG